LLGLFNPEDVGDMFLRNVGCLSGLHSIIFEKIVVLSITTAVRTSNPTLRIINVGAGSNKCSLWVT
jgi:hypothetical protein